MNRQVIKDWRGTIIGFIETDVNGDKTARDFSQKIVGFYKKGTDYTTDFSGRKVSKGDTVISLLYNNKK